MPATVLAPNFRTVPNRSYRKDEAAESPQAKLIRELDSLNEMGKKGRDDALGSDWENDIRSFYMVEDGDLVSPSFRPRVRIPELQTLLLNEATDLSDTTPIVYIANQDERDKDREKAFGAYWRQGFFNNRLLNIYLYSLLSGISYGQVVFDPLARRGQGSVYLKPRDTSNTFPDPYATNESDWFFVQMVDRLYPDQIWRNWPASRGRVKSNGYTPVNTAANGFSLSGSFSMPPGPMSLTGGFGTAAPSAFDGREVVRTTFLYDGTVERMEEKLGSKSTNGRLAAPKLKYPDGRMIIDCQGHVIFDDNNPFPLSRFPVVRFLSMPAIYGWYPPPPVRFTRSMQSLAERFYTQLFENMVRMNNGIWFIPEECGIDPEDFGGLPGEVRVISANAGKLPECKWPQQMPAQMIEVPDKLLAMQRTIQGFSTSRSGDSGAGNTGADLFDASVYQSQYLTRLRSRLMSESIQKVVELTFYTMARYFVHDQKFVNWKYDSEAQENIPDTFKWSGTGSSHLDDFDIVLDPGSIRQFSSMALNKLALLLRQQGAIDTRSLLETLDFPRGSEIASNMEREQALQALSRISRRK